MNAPTARRVSRTALHADAARPHILVVDDQPLQLKSQRMHLEKAGYRVTVAGSAAEALQALRHETPNLVLSDVMMPGTDGFQLCRALRRDPTHGSLPVVLVSGHYGEALDVRHAAHCGANMFVARSDGTEVLLQGIQQALAVPGARLEPADDPSLDAEHGSRVLDQLDRLSKANLDATHKIQAQERFLAQLGGTAERLAGEINPERLAAHFVAAGLPKVLIYRLDAAGKLQLADAAGCANLATDAGDLFNARAFLEELVARNQRVVLPDAAAPAAMLELVQARGYRSAALLPLACAAERFGLLVVLCDQQDRRTGDWAVFARAMATQVGAILSLGRSRQQIHDSREQLRTILNGIADGVFVTDGAFVVQDANPAMEQLAGYSQREARGKSLMSFVAPEERARAPGELRRYLATGQYDGDVLFLRKDGSVRCARITGRRVRPDLYVNIVRDVTEAQRNEEEMHRLAHTDVLTGLANRMAFQKRVDAATSAAIHAGHATGILLLSLGNFRQINDTLGPDGGDRVLCETAARVKEAAVGSDIVSARLGAAQFAVLIPRLESPEHQVRAAHALLSLLSAPITVDGIPVEVVPCIGAARCPEDAIIGNELLRRASVAMHHAREHHLAFAAYDAAHDPFDLGQLTLVSELRHAITHNHLELWYQPKLDLRSGRVDAVEALVRWRHPERGLIPPDDFIPAAERTGLIHLVTGWVVRTALRQAGQWREQGLALNVAINISQSDLREDSFQTELLKALKVNRVPASSVTLEITETAAMQDPKRAAHALGELRRHGLRISLDDFGTGQASLAHLHQLPVDEIKLDKSFVLALPSDHSKSIAGATALLAREFGLNSVAEGMESADCQRLLGELGFDRVQGYFLSKPLPAAQLEAWMRQRDLAAAA